MKNGRTRALIAYLVICSSHFSLLRRASVAHRDLIILHGLRNERRKCGKCEA